MGRERRVGGLGVVEGGRFRGARGARESRFGRDDVCIDGEIENVSESRVQLGSDRLLKRGERDAAVKSRRVVLTALVNVEVVVVVLAGVIVIVIIVVVLFRQAASLQ